MKNLGELRDLVEGAYIIGDENSEVSSIVHDSRKAQANSLFACIKGHHVDGHKFIGSAKENGATSIITDDEDAALPVGVNVLVVPNLAAALRLIVPYFYDYPASKMRFIGVTGTNGKTSTTYLLKAIFTKMGFRVGVIGTIHIDVAGEILPATNTTPDVIDLQQILAYMVSKNIDYVIMEVSSHALALDRVAGISFQVGIFTNLTQDHLDFHKTMEEYAKAKAILFQGLAEDSTAIINADDSWAKAVLGESKARKFFYGINSANLDIVAKNIELRRTGLQFSLGVGSTGELPLTAKLTGLFNVYNILGSIGAAMAEGIPLSIIKEALSEFQGVPGRLEILATDTDFTVIVDYAHTPDGLENILLAAREITDNRVLTVFGCGGDRDNTKRPIMGRIAARLSDVVIVTSDNPRSEEPEAIISEIVAGLEEEIGEKEYYSLVGREEAITKAALLATPGDVVIIAGKGHENYQILKDKTIHFDDKEVALNAVENLKSH